MLALENYAFSACLVPLAGRLVAGLITDFLQVFNLDFTLAVFQPEISTVCQCYIIYNAVSDTKFEACHSEMYEYCFFD